jgi:hypothetical protein
VYAFVNVHNMRTLLYETRTGRGIGRGGITLVPTLL